MPRSIPLLNAPEHLLLLRLHGSFPVAPVPVAKRRAGQQQAAEDVEDGIVGIALSRLVRQCRM